jgi:hypothetical protein
MEWRPIKTAPKPDKREPFKEIWILGIDRYKQQRVIRWCQEYPCDEGVWMFAYAPTDYIDNIQTFDPLYWMPLPDLPTEFK